MFDLSTDLVETKWSKLQKEIQASFDKKIDINAALFLIGIQELGKGFKTFTKEQKQDLMHIANCRILSASDYYELKGIDDDGWPHWENKNPLPVLTLEEQDVFLKHHIVLYFSDIYDL